MSDQINITPSTDGGPPSPETLSGPAPANRVLQLVRDTDPFGRPRRRKVAIVGFTDHRVQAPFGNPEFEIWGLNELYRYMDPRQFTRWFELHDRKGFEQHDPEHLKSLAQFGIPIYMHQHFDDIPPSVPLPKGFIEASVPRGDYMTSSIAWMLGLVIAEDFDVVHVYGVDLAQDTEYVSQRPCVEYLLGILAGRGKEIYLPKTSDILKSVGQYGFGAGGEFALKLEERIAWLNREQQSWIQKDQQLEREVKAKREALEAEYQGHKHNIATNIHQLAGARDDCGYWQRSWAVRPDLQPGQSPTPDRTKDPATGIDVQPAAALVEAAPAPSGNNAGG